MTWNFPDILKDALVCPIPKVEIQPLFLSGSGSAHVFMTSDLIKGYMDM